MSTPSRDTAAGRAYLDLQKLARTQKRPTDELFRLYALEGFLARLAASPHVSRLVLKGGVLLRRTTPAGRPVTSTSKRCRCPTTWTICSMS